MDCALSFSQVLTGTSPNMMTISARSLSTKPHVFFRNNLSPSISKFSNNVFCGTSKLLRSSQILGHHAFVSPLVLAQGFFSDQAGKGDGGGKTTRIMISSEPTTFGASFALACVLGIFCFPSMLVLSPGKAMADPPLSTVDDVSQHSQEPNFRLPPMNGKYVLRKFMKGVVFLGSQPTTVSQLKEQALMKMKVGMTHNEVVNQMKLAAKNIDTGPAGDYDLHMALVEILILQGKYKEASELEKNIPVDTEIGPSDETRRSLYRAIIHTVLGNKDIAEKAWQQFIDKGFKEAGWDIPTPDDEEP